MASRVAQLIAALALHGPVAWAASWNARVARAYLAEAFDPEQPMTVSAVLPWRAKAQREEVTQ
jgi:hypothetical protein